MTAACKVGGYLSLYKTTELISRVTVLFMDEQCMGDPLSLHRCQNVEVSVFLMSAILIDVECYLIVALICILLMANEDEHLFICLFICLFLCYTCSLVKCLCESFAHFSTGLFVFFLLGLGVHCILNTSL